MRRLKVAAVVASALFVSQGQPLHAIVWHANARAAPQTEAPGPMRNLVSLHYTKARVFGGSGIQLDDRWVLVAKHEVKIWIPEMLQVRRGEERLDVKRVILHPDEKVDLALIELSTPTAPPEKIILHSAAAKPAKNTRLWLGGFGKSGPAGKAGRAGKFAAGFNRLESIENQRGKIVFDKDVKDEVLPSRYDSGSPVFIRVENQWQLFGITVTASNSKNPKYGDRSHHQLIAPAHQWLNDHLNL